MLVKILNITKSMTKDFKIFYKKIIMVNFKFLNIWKTGYFEVYYNYNINFILFINYNKIYNKYL